MPNLMLDEPGTVLASSLVGDSQMEDGHYKTKCEKLELQVEAQQKIISNKEAELSDKEAELRDKAAELSQKEQVSFLQNFLFILQAS